MAEKNNVIHYPGSFNNLAYFLNRKLIWVLFLLPMLKIIKDTQLYLFVPAYILETVSFLLHTTFLPYVLAGLIQNYFLKDDWRNVMNVRYISLVVFISASVIFSILFYISSFFLPNIIFGTNLSAFDQSILRTSFALLVPLFVLRAVLSCYRGYYLGLIDNELVDQSFRNENIVYCVCTLVAALFFRYSKVSSIYLIYVILFACSAGVLYALYTLIRYDRTIVGKMNRLARKTETKDIHLNTFLKLFLKNIAFYGMPTIYFFLYTIISYFLLVPTFTSMHISFLQAVLQYGIIFLLGELPYILMLFFVKVINQPFLDALFNAEDKSIKEAIEKLIISTILIILPIGFVISSLGNGIYDFYFGSQNLILGRGILIGSNLCAVFMVLAFVSSSILIALNYKKKAYTYLIIAFLLKAIIYYPVIQYMGVRGLYMVSILSNLSLFYLNTFKIQRLYHCDLKLMFIRLFKIILSIFAMNGLFGILRLMKFTISNTTWYIQLLQILGIGLAGFIIYGFIINSFRLVEAIYGTTFIKIFKKWNRMK